MGIPGHVVTSAAAFAATFAVTSSISFALGTAGASLLLDVDHLWDYWFIDRQYNLNPSRFFKYYRRRLPPRRILLLHSYELLALLLVFALLTGANAVGGFVLGALIHLGADILPRKSSGVWQVTKRYSLIYRWRRGFDSKRLYH